MSSSPISFISVAGDDPLISFTIVLEGSPAILAVAGLVFALVSAVVVIANPPAIRN